MKGPTIIVIALALAGCATAHQEERINAVKDFVEVNDLEQAESIRSFEQLGQEVLNDEYVIVSTRREQWLLEYAYRCVEDPISRRTRPDVRRDPGRIYAGSDTFRGCQIRALYPITAEQAEELREIGKAPGER